MVIEDHPQDRHRSRPWWFRPALAAILLGGVIGLLAPESLPFLRLELASASSCDGRTWPATEISCKAAENTSVIHMPPQNPAPPGRWEVRIWLTTLDAVDARFQPRRQVAAHPTGAKDPVWLYIYEKIEGPGAADRILHVAPASNARPGAFVYLYRWSELGSPTVPETMPSIR